MADQPQVPTNTVEAQAVLPNEPPSAAAQGYAVLPQPVPAVQAQPDQISLEV